MALVTTRAPRLTQYLLHGGGTFSAALEGSLGRSPPKYEMHCLGQISIPVQNFSQMRSAVSEQFHPEQTDRETADLISAITVVTQFMDMMDIVLQQRSNVQLTDVEW